MINNQDFLFYFIQKSIDEGRINSNVARNNHQLSKRFDFFNFKKDIDDFLNGNVNNRFIVLSGLRGIGKTTLFFQLYNYLLSMGININQILYFSSKRLNQLLKNNIYDVVEFFIKEYYNHSINEIDRELFIFVDDVEVTDDFIKWGEAIYNASNKIFMIFSTSPHNFGASNICLKKRIFPINFNEYLSFKHDFSLNHVISNKLINTILSGKLGDIRKVEKETYLALPDMDSSIDIELERYLSQGAFLDTMHLNKFEAYKKNYKRIQNMIQKDIFYSLGSNTTPNEISRLLVSITLKKPGFLSIDDISRVTNLSPYHIRKMINILEESQLIYQIKACNGGCKLSKKPSKYYFSSPNFHVAFSSEIGGYNLWDNNYLNILAETLIVSTFFKLKLSGVPLEIYYPSYKNHANFLICKDDDSFVPVEVDYGVKVKKHVLKSMDKFDSQYGIILSDNIPFMKKEDDIIYIPFTTFSCI